MKARKKIDKVLNNISNKLRLYELVNNNSGMGVVEIILIILLVLIGLVVIFRTQITSIVNKIFSKITSKVNTF